MSGAPGLSPGLSKGLSPGAAGVVPPSGFTVRLTLVTAAAMAFLAVFALALALAAGRLAVQWDAALAQSATLRLSAPADQIGAQTDTALAVLSQTPGVADARLLETEETRALLEPWFGPDLPLETLPIPRLIAIEETAEGFDADGLRLRLQAEVPGAVLDTHARWRRPLVEAASVLRLLGWASIALIAAVTAAMVTLAARAALAANAQVIAVLRLVGATDAYIAGAFVRRYTLRTVTGAALGTALGVAGLLLVPDAGTQTVLTSLRPAGWEWALAALIPPLAAAVAWLATRTAAHRVLAGLA